MFWFDREGNQHVTADPAYVKLSDMNIIERNKSKNNLPRELRLQVQAEGGCWVREEKKECTDVTKERKERKEIKDALGREGRQRTIDAEDIDECEFDRLNINPLRDPETRYYTMKKYRLKILYQRPVTHELLLGWGSKGGKSSYYKFLYAISHKKSSMRRECDTIQHVTKTCDFDRHCPRRVTLACAVAKLLIFLGYDDVSEEYLGSPILSTLEIWSQRLHERLNENNDLQSYFRNNNGENIKYLVENVGQQNVNCPFNVGEIPSAQEFITFVKKVLLKHYGNKYPLSITRKQHKRIPKAKQVDGGPKFRSSYIIHHKQRQAYLAMFIRATTDLNTDRFYHDIVKQRIRELMPEFADEPPAIAPPPGEPPRKRQRLGDS